MKKTKRMLSYEILVGIEGSNQSIPMNPCQSFEFPIVFEIECSHFIQNPHSHEDEVSIMMPSLLIKPRHIAGISIGSDLIAMGRSLYSSRRCQYENDNDNDLKDNMNHLVAFRFT